MGKLPKQSEPHSEELPPPPVVPWRVPPMGSMGDAWDDVVVLPVDLVIESEHPTKRVRVAKKRTRPDEILFLDRLPRIHWAAIIAWVFLAMAVLSTGPALPLMGLMTLVGLVMGAMAIFLIKTVHPDFVGVRIGWAAIGFAIVLLVFDSWRPNNPWFEAHFERSAASIHKAMSFDDKMILVERNMQLMAQAAHCTWELLGTEDSTELGRNSVNRTVYPKSVYFPISTLPAVENIEIDNQISADLLVYTATNLPKDPFADDSHATFGVFFTNKHIIVFSAGPDGVWQLNPRRPVEPDDPNPEAKLAPFRYNPLLGNDGEGDLILIAPLEQKDVYLFCDEIRQKLEEEE